MNLLVINLDKGIFNKNTQSLRRLEEYSRLVDKIFVIVWTRKKEEPIIINNKLFIYPTNSLFKFLYYVDSFRLAGKILKHNHIDLIFTQDPFETGLAGWIISKIKKIPLQIQIHTDILSPYFKKESLFNHIRVLVAGFLIPRADCIRVVSERIKISLLSTFNISPSKIITLPILIDLGNSENKSMNSSVRRKYSQFDFIILMASRFTREKNIGLAIDVLEEIVKKYPNTGLVIVGAGYEQKKYSAIIKRRNLHNNIIIESWTDNIGEYYEMADLFLLTSNYEGWGMVVVEAAAASLPIIMTDVGLAGEIIKDGESGLIIPVGDREALKIAMIKLIEDKNLREKLGQSAKQAVQKLPSKEEYLETYKKSWESCLAFSRDNE